MHDFAYICGLDNIIGDMTSSKFWQRYRRCEFDRVDLRQQHVPPRICPTRQTKLEEISRENLIHQGRVKARLGLPQTFF